MKFAKVLTMSGVAAAVLATAVFAQANEAHEKRETLMKGMGKELGPLVAMVQGKSDYDGAKAKAAADKLAELANSDWQPLFPEGSDAGTRAKPEIWSDWDGFMADKEDLAAATTELAASAGDGLDTLKAKFGPVGGACGACHKAYRAAE